MLPLAWKRAKIASNPLKLLQNDHFISSLIALPPQMVMLDFDEL